MEADTRAGGVAPEQDKTDFLNLIESLFPLLEKARKTALSPTISTESSVKSNRSSGSVQKSESVSGAKNGRAKSLGEGFVHFFYFLCCCSLYVAIFYA